MSFKKNTNCSPLLILLKLQLLLILYSADLAASSTCPTKCGKIKIPYPFGIGNNCYLDKSYEVECRNTNTSGKLAPSLPAIGKEVVSITLPNEEHYFSSISYGFVSSEAYGLVRVKNPITSTGCFSDGKKSTEPVLNLTGSPFFSDGLNSLIAAGCNAKVSLTHIKPSMMGCELNCNTRRDSHLNSIPFFNKTGCSTHIFSYDNSEACEDNKPGDTECDGNGCCKENLGAEPRQIIGIRIESNDGNSTTRQHCRVAFLTLYSILVRFSGVGAGFGVLLLVGGVWGLRKFLIKRRMTKRKKKFFKRNGGLLLQQELNTRQGNVEKTRIFSSKELGKATENFSENRVLGHGGQGTVYKGMLLDGRTVAVKKSKVIDEDKLQEFINEVVILSQINHRHVVKLLGCCLETEVPMLVYEFILNGNLYQHLHEESDDYTMRWGMRLRVAVDIAGALSYLHSSASSPIYHRDIKSSNILLDEKYRAKVADFGTSRSITIDQTHWTTVVSGTVGYLDPEYYRSSQYTDKSDVYSFGVVLAELVTGDKPVIIVQNTQEKRSLAEHFRDAIKEKRFFEIMDARIRDDCKPEQVMAVANLAVKCLSPKGKNRPNMRQVFTELERICTSSEDSQVQIQIDGDVDEEEEEEVTKTTNRSHSWSIGVTAPIVASTSSSDVEPLFPRLT